MYIDLVYSCTYLHYVINYFCYITIKFRSMYVHTSYIALVIDVFRLIDAWGLFA